MKSFELVGLFGPFGGFPILTNFTVNSFSLGKQTFIDGVVNSAFML